MDAAITDNNLPDGEKHDDTHESDMKTPDLMPSQDSFVSGISFPQLFLWNRILFGSSMLLCICQCLGTYLGCAAYVD